MKTAEHEVKLTGTDKQRVNLHGKLAAIKLRTGPHQNLTLYGNIVDSTVEELPDGRREARPKRVRVQWGLPELHGAVLQPSHYEFLWLAEEEQD